MKFISVLCFCSKKCVSKGNNDTAATAQGLCRVFRLLGLGIPTSETSEKGAILLLLLLFHSELQRFSLSIYFPGFFFGRSLAEWKMEEDGTIERFLINCKKFSGMNLPWSD